MTVCALAGEHGGLEAEEDPDPDTQPVHEHRHPLSHKDVASNLT